ncbi:MAG: repeat-containing protein [Thermoleophilia bacterium]|nr:repeat-containing protein [Thermoleophilia bacterium]
MRRDSVPPEGDEDPLDAALGDLQDLAELEHRFALLDAKIDAVESKLDANPDQIDVDSVIDDSDPFSDIARALREQRAQLDASSAEDADDDSSRFEDDSQLELSLEEDDDFSLEDDDEDDDDPVAAEIEERCQDALDALEADDTSLAREIAMAAVRLDDEHPFPMFVLGLIAERVGDLDTARDMAELSLRTAGTNPDAIGLRAHIHVRQHELAEAADLLRFGIAHNPDDATLHEGLARVALARGEHQEALASAGAALRIEPNNVGALAVRAAALDEGGDRSGLLAALRQGVQLHPEDPYAMVELASVEMEHGNLERARVLLMRAQRLAPRDPEIGDVRALVEYVHERPLLRPVPALVRWMRDFPGGLPGFLVGFVIASLPLHALATAAPAYRIPAVAVIVAWGLVALYAWIAPAMLTHRLNQRAARGGARRMTEDMRDPLAALPPLDRLTDVVSMLGAARDRRGAVELLELGAACAQTHGKRTLVAGADVASEAAPLLAGMARRMRGPRARIQSALLAVPVLPRLFVAASIAAAVAAPALATATMLPMLAWHALALVLLGAAWVLVLIERAWARDVEESLAAVQLASAATPRL